MDHLSNLKSPGRWLRISLGVFLLYVGWSVDIPSSEAWATGLTHSLVALRIVGLYPLITGLAGWCPIRSLIAGQHAAAGRSDNVKSSAEITH